jgi:hypothetical protein
MSREQIIEKVAEDLWLTLEKRDGLFVFRFPDVWKPKDVQDMQRTVLDGIAMLEAQRSLIVWLKDSIAFMRPLKETWYVIFGGCIDIAFTISIIYLMVLSIYRDIFIALFTFAIGIFGIALSNMFICSEIYMAKERRESEKTFKKNQEYIRHQFDEIGKEIEARLLRENPLCENDPRQKLKKPAMSYQARQGRKTLILMKDIEAELEERSDPARKAIPWGYATKESDDAPNPIAQAALEDWIAITGKINKPPYGGPSNSAFLALVEALDARLSHEDARQEQPLKSDDRYEEPQAIYPMEMKI